ncbi:MAG: proline dehydrogenase family protein [Candidatus Micrarchaeia archaeon]|jgi:proline dehydrogenase
MCAQQLVYPNLGEPTRRDRMAQFFGAKRYIAGTDMEKAVIVARGFHARSMPVILDLLGEAGNGSGTKSERIRKTLAVGDVVAQLATDEGLKMAMAIRPGQFENDHTALRNMAATLADRGIFVWIDMERMGAVQATLDSYKRCAVARPGMIGLALQAYLQRTERDLQNLLEFSSNGGVPIELRFVRGVYLDEADVGGFSAMHENLARLVYTALKSDIPQVRVHMASHNPEQVARAILLRRIYGERMASNQLLLGVYRDEMPNFLETDPRAQKTPATIYVPFGPDVEKYLTRRKEEAGKTMFALWAMGFREGRNTIKLRDILDSVDAGLGTMNMSSDKLPFDYVEL